MNLVSSVPTSDFNNVRPKSCDDIMELRLRSLPPLLLIRHFIFLIFLLQHPLIHFFLLIFLFLRFFLRPPLFFLSFLLFFLNLLLDFHSFSTSILFPSLPPPFYPLSLSLLYSLFIFFLFFLFLYILPSFYQA
jgi:hypothetical protein